MTDLNLFKRANQTLEEVLQADKESRIELLKLQTDELQSETERLNKTMEALGFDNIGNVGFDDTLLNEIVDSLAEVALLLEVDDFSEAGLDLAISDLRLKAAKKPLSNLASTRKQGNLQKDELEAIHTLSVSEETLKKAESGDSDRQSEILQMKNKLVFLTRKQKDYQKQFEKYSSMLKMSGYREDISHQAISQLKASLDSATQNELTPLRLKLDGYRGLPPNKDLAVARIAEAEKELENLTVALTKAISSLHV